MFLLFFIEQKVSRGKLSFFAYIISGEQSTNQPRQLQNDALHVKTSQSVKNTLNPAKNENRPKTNICPFCTKAFNYMYTLATEETQINVMVKVFSPRGCNTPCRAEM